MTGRSTPIGLMQFLTEDIGTLQNWNDFNMYGPVLMEQLFFKAAATCTNVHENSMSRSHLL